MPRTLFIPLLCLWFPVSLAFSFGCSGKSSNPSTIDCLDKDNDGFGRGLDCLGGDCMDSDPLVHPGAQELCNELDDDCDGQTDEDLNCPGCLDEDGDGYGNGETCLGPDCRDRDSACHEGTCCYAASNCVDGDGDGFGAGSDCLGPDCDDSDPSCRAGSCCPMDCVDLDGDGRGVGADCFAPDCKDDDPACWQGSCCPGGCTDGDGDGYGSGDSCSGPDCDDSNPAVHPGAMEGCNSIDDNCDGQTDEDDACPTCLDDDGDGYGANCPAGQDCDDTDNSCHEGTCCQPVQASLEIYLLDIWAQELPQAITSFSLTMNNAAVEHQGHPIVSAPLRQAGIYDLELAAHNHETLAFSISFDGSGDSQAISLLGGAHEWDAISMSHDLRDVDGQPTMVHTIYLGLTHKWFSAAGRPARRGNAVELLINGEEAWGRIHGDLLGAQNTVHAASWWWMSDFELIRNWSTHAYLSESERWANTIMGILDSNMAQVRVLVGEFWGTHSIMDFMTTDDMLLAKAEQAGDDFEFMGQGNSSSGTFMINFPGVRFQDRVQDSFPETTGRSFDVEVEVPSILSPYVVDMTDWPIFDLEIQIASWHQKFMVIDDRVAYIGGMNIKTTDWDSLDQIVFDHRRMNYDATLEEREQVINKERDTDLGPRRDYILRVEGPAVQDAAKIFQERWEQTINDQASFYENSTTFTIAQNQPELPGGKQVQVTATMPAPFSEYAIAETWFNAVAQATDFILIEDQYWRVPWLVDAIVERMRQVPTLKLLVITKPVSEWADPGCEWTAETHHQLLGEFGAARYRTYQLMTFDSVVTWGWDETESRFMNIDVHSKLLIVDDKFLSVGSCNKNNRGLLYEGELNAAVLDPVWVRDQRRRVLATIMPAGTPATDDSSVWWGQFQQAAAANDAVYSEWDDEGWDINNGDGSGPLPAQYVPHGFIYTLEFRTSDYCFLEGVGPDMTR